MNIYHVFFDGKVAQVQADTALEARTAGLAALRKMGGRISKGREYLATPILVQKDGADIIHAPQGITP